MGENKLENGMDQHAADGQQEMSVEEAFGELEKILAEMEKEDATLEGSFANYERGMKLIRLCNEKIDLVEKKVQMMNADGSLSDFE